LTFDIIDVLFHCLQSPPEMGFFMGFDGINWIQSKFRKEVKEPVEIEPPFAHGEMLIHFFMIVVEMNLC
jgi:hypothetical protein